MVEAEKEDSPNSKKPLSAADAAPTPILIDTMAEAAKACAFLRMHKVLAMDMEGAPLEKRTSLLQLAASPNEVMICDGMPFFCPSFVPLCIL